MKHCECGCGEEARPGKRFARYHQVANDGRAMVWVKEKRRYEFRYRLIMAAHIGRPLEPMECVHHKNGDHRDDRFENLELCASNSEHKSKHHNRYQSEFPCLICGKIHKGEIRRKYHFCGKDCRSRWTPPGAPTTTGMGKRVTIVCRECGKSVVRKGPGPFCSPGCYRDSLRGCPSKPRSDNRSITYNGDRLTVPEWARKLGVTYKALMNRVQMGWDDDRIISQPFRKSPNRG